MENEFFIKSYEESDATLDTLSLIGSSSTLLFWTRRILTNSGYYILATDKDLNVVFLRNINKTEHFNGSLQQAVPCANGDVLIFGNYLPSNSSENSTIAFRISPSGNLIWTKRYELFGNSQGLRITSLNNGEYVIFNSQFSLLFTINEQGNIINTTQFPSELSILADSLIVHNQNIYCITSDRNNSNTVLFGLAKFDLQLNLLSITEYKFNSDIGSFPNVEDFFLHGDILVVSNVVFGGVEESYLYLSRIDLSNPLPQQITSKRFFSTSGNNTLTDVVQSANYLYIFDKSTDLIHRFDFNLNFTDDFSKSSSDIRDIYTTPTALYFTLSNSRILKTGQSYESDGCFQFDDGNAPVLEDVIFFKDDSLTIIANSFSLAAINDSSFTITEIFIPEFITICKFSTITQSPHLYLQAAGSTGNDGTTSGIHLRWLLKNELNNHLPKGNLATGTANYNKPDDFVTLFRAPYIPVTVDVNLLTPKGVENRTGTWIYQEGNHTFALYFRNLTQYRATRNSFNPLTQTQQFLQNYGNEVLEFQPANDLFYAVGLTSSSTSTAARVESEILSVEGSTAQGNKQLSARKTFIGAALTNARLVTENGKGFRFRCTNCYLTGFAIELYSELQNSIESGSGWTELGQFSLSQTDTEVFNRLESNNGQVNAAWPRFNDDAYVNVQNYKDKWNQTSASTQSSIKQTVQDYITLSNNEDNPTAIETFSFDDNPEGVTAADNTFELPNLLLLQQAAMDFHVARMLGLGHLDTDTTVQNNNSFVYLAVYQTNVNMVDGELIEEPTAHRYMTIPTSRSDERLPVPIELKPPMPGLFTRSGLGESQESLTDDEGYTQDGKSRYVSLFIDEPVELSYDRGFYSVNTEFNIAQETFPVFAGVEYKGTLEQNWRSPELANTADYKNVTATGQVSSNETVALPIPDEGIPIFVHREKENGEHTYSSYGINWFSRITRGTTTHNLNTVIVPRNTLNPPGDRSALLITEEQPLLLTTANEQQVFSTISGEDKTLIRLLFNYHTNQELVSYQVTEFSLNGATNPLDSNAIFPDSQEVFADEVEIYFRDNLPLTISGKAIAITDDSNELLSVITTGNYRLDSEGEDVIPNIPQSLMPNFVGGVLVLEEDEYIIHSVQGNENNPTIKVYKKQASDRIQDTDAPPISAELTSPIIKEDGRILAVENLQNVNSWGTPNPHPLKVQIGNNWPIHREVVEQLNPDGVLEQYLQKTRGIWDNATIERVLQPANPGGATQVHLGQYRATFGTAMLDNHPQFNGANPVQWYKGIIRVHTIGNPNGDRRELEVYKIENIGTNTALVVYFKDKDFRNDQNHDEIQIGGSIQINFYPSYRIHLFANQAAGITSDNILPQAGDGIKYTCFGFRSLNNSNGYSSRVAIPTVLFAQEEIEPLVPQLPVGTQFATRPDRFGKATYTFTTQFEHIPHGTLFYRTDENAILSALYTAETVNEVKAALAASDLDFLPNRWQNLLSFDYDYPSNSFQTDGLFAIFPETSDGYRLPNPNNPLLFMPGETPGDLIPSSIANRIKVVILENFVSLTEIPILYEHIRGSDYNPVAKKQVVRDRNGQLLLPTDTNFDMAPMAKIPSANKVQFTDFTLDGTSNNIYFYATRELSATMKMGEFSPILGPVKLVNTSPPKKPSIRKVVPILESTSLGISPQMEIAVNAYPKVENIKKLALYRALNPFDALSIRTMEFVKDINLDTIEVLDENIWIINDEFTDLQEVPFGDPLYYRVIVSREIEYPDKDDINTILTEYTPSEASKLVITAIVENNNPEAPELSFTSDSINAAFELDNVVLSWEKSAYNSKYYVYKLNNQGQWVKIHEVLSNEQTITLPLASTDLGSNILSIEDIDNQSVYHQFRVVAENTAGLLSQQDKILTIPDTDAYDGIGGMGIENTFIIR